MLRDRFSADQWDDIDLAAAKYQIDPDFLATVILNESSGNWEEYADRVIDTATHRFLPYVGIEANVAWKHRVYVEDIKGDRRAQVNLLARILKGILEGIDPYVLAAQHWYAGSTVPHQTVQYYSGKVRDTMKKLKEERNAPDRD